MRRTFIIQNKLGLHARAAAQLVQLASSFDAELSITKDGQTVNGKSIMGLMMLAASQGARIQADADGPDAEPLLAAIEALVEAKFNESQ